MRAEEGYDGLPDEFEIKTDKNGNFQNANFCQSCNKDFKAKIIKVGTGRHHC